MSVLFVTTKSRQDACAPRFTAHCVGVGVDAGALWRGSRSVWLALSHWANTAGLFAYLFFMSASSLRTAATPLSIASSSAVPAATRWPLPVDCALKASSSALMSALRSSRVRLDLVSDKLRGEWRRGPRERRARRSANFDRYPQPASGTCHQARGLRRS